MTERLLLIKKGDFFPSKLLQRFEQEGYHVQFCMKKELIVPYLATVSPSIIILEGWNFPEFEEIIAQCIDRRPRTPLVVLSEEKRVAIKVKILEMGVVDYLEIPYHGEELVARVKTHLRREQHLLNSIKNKKQNGKVFHYNPRRNEIYKKQQPLQLSLREYQLLRYLLTKENHIFSRKELLNKVWGYGERQEQYCDIRTVDVTVRRIREKIEDNSNKPKHLLTKRGLGYYFQNRDIDEGPRSPSSVEITLKK